MEEIKDLGYELKKGIIIKANKAITCSDTFYSEDKLKEYWYNESSEIFFENTKKGIKDLIDFHTE